jgi:hypothetical protein
MQRKFWILALVGAILLSASPVLADGEIYVIGGGGGVGTKITSLPYEIKSPGFYYLARNLNAATGNGIMINSDNVILDLMGFCLSSSGGSWKGISNVVGYKNIEIRNGFLTGWGFGIDLAAANNVFSGLRIINVRVMGGNTECIRIEGGGIGNLVKGCTVSDALGIGISVNNGNATISGNTVYNCSTGIRLTQGSIIGNNVYCNTGQTGIMISGSATDWVLVDQNTVNGNGTTLSGSGAIRFGLNAFYEVDP